MMNNCSIGGPYWKRKNCPGEYDASHTCRACQLQKLSVKRVERPYHPDLDRGYQLYLFHSNILVDLN